MNTSEDQLSPVEQEVVRRLRAAASAAEQAPRITEASTIIRTTHPSVLRRVAAFRVTTVVVAVVGITAILFFAPLPGLHLAHRGSSIPGTQSSTTIASPPVQTASLSRLSHVDSFTCLSSSWCVVETGVTGNLQLDLWNGRALTVMDAPGGLHGTAHMSISCFSSELCAAGGFDGRAVLLVWNGSVWKFSQPPNVPSRGGAASFNGVSCPSSQGCLAVGEDARGALVATWNGIRWSISTDTIGNGRGSWSLALLSVSCTSSTSCIAVGSHYNRGTEPVVESWDGSTWTLVLSPVVDKSAHAENRSAHAETFAELVSVQCLATNLCWAVGDVQRQKALAERWDGRTWSPVAVPPVPRNAKSDALDSVSCTSGDACLAVGVYFKASSSGLRSPTGSSAMAIWWDGSAWRRVQASANDGYNYSELSNLVCLATRSCLGLDGRTATSNQASPSLNTIEAWNGRSWVGLGHRR